MLDIESSSSGSCSEFDIIKTLGKGAFGVVQVGQHQKTGDRYALKIIDCSAPNLDVKNLQKEILIMKELDHKNILKLHSSFPTDYKFGNGQTQLVMLMIMDLFPKGTLLDHIYQSGGQPEALIRNQFYDLVSAIKYCHDLGVVHRDIKPQNLLMSNDYDIILADFGLSTVINNTTLLQSYKGTEAYMAPEILNMQSYDGKKIDIFALGVTLFIMYKGNPPFNSASNSDFWWKLFVNNPKKFWEVQNKQFPISLEFQDLFNNMCALNSMERYNIDQVIEHPWLQGQACSNEEKKLFYSQMENQISERIEKERAELQQQLNNQNVQPVGIKPFRSSETLNQYAMDITSVDFDLDRKIQKSKDLFSQGFMRQYRVVMPLDLAFKLACITANKFTSQFTVSETEYQIECFTSSDEEGVCKYKIQLFQINADEDDWMFEFSLESGSYFLFMKRVKEMQDFINSEQLDFEQNG